MQKSSTDSEFLPVLRQELPFLLDALTTEPSFFRKKEQFAFLEAVLADHRRHNALAPSAFLVIGGDAGIDAYSLCLTLIACTRRSPFPYSVLATEFLPEQASQATKGIYPLSAFDPADLTETKKYLLRSRNRTPEQIRLRPGVRTLVQVRCADIFTHFALREQMDVIFCRHILHHFHPHIARKLAERLRTHLAPGGLLFLGEETGRLHGFRKIGPAIYQMV